MIEAYKCFNSGLIDQYGQKYQIGKIYHADNKIKFHKNGFHMCTNLEDTLRYFDSFEEDIDIATVSGFGNFDKYDDEYNEFFDMYATEYMLIKHVLTRDEIIAYASGISEMRLKRFLSLYKLNDFELHYFKEKCKKSRMLLETINYYQENHEKTKLLKK